MFNLFKKKAPAVSATDIVWIDSVAKKKGLLQLLQQKPGAVLCAWFDDTATDFATWLQQEQVAVDVFLQRQLHSSIVSGKPLIFLEHYPLYTKEQNFFTSIQPADITVISSLDEPLLVHFGSDRIVAMMRSLGMQENEPISHQMITSAIQQAQKKLEQKVETEFAAASMQEWFRKNADR